MKCSFLVRAWPSRLVSPSPHPTHPSMFELDFLPLLLLVAVAIFAWVQRHSEAKLLEFPGPRRLPLVGNLFVDVVHEQMAALSQHFGPIFSVNLFGTKAIVVTSVSVARELFVNRFGTYSNRLPLKMIELCNFHQGLLFQPDQQKLRQGRQLLLKGLARRELERYRHIIHDHSVRFLDNLLHTPEDFMNHINHAVLSVSIEIGYGHRVTGHDDPLFRQSAKWVQRFSNTIAFGSFLVNVFPFLEYFPAWLPIASFKKTAAEWTKSANEFRWDAYDSVKSAVVNGDAQPSVISKALTEFVHTLEEDAIANSAAQILTGGHTTVCTLQTFILAMVRNPDVQETARSEILRVIGPNRMPAISDWDDLPYVAAIVRETLRWHPVIPLLTRNPIEDDVYNGYLVQKDTMIIVNYWAMLHDETIFPDHAAFRPERWLEMNINRTNDPFEIAFGFGRRLCPGRASTKEMLFTLMASMLAVFKISKVSDAYGKVVTPPEEFISGGIVGPAPFNCRIEPHSEQARNLLEYSLQEL